MRNIRNIYFYRNDNSLSNPCYYMFNDVDNNNVALSEAKIFLLPFVFCVPPFSADAHVLVIILVQHHLWLVSFVPSTSDAYRRHATKSTQTSQAVGSLIRMTSPPPPSWAGLRPSNSHAAAVCTLFYTGFLEFVVPHRRFRHISRHNDY